MQQKIVSNLSEQLNAAIVYLDEALKKTPIEEDIYLELTDMRSRLASIKLGLDQGFHTTEPIPCAGCGKPSGSFGEPRPNTIYRCAKCDD